MLTFESAFNLEQHFTCPFFIENISNTFLPASPFWRRELKKNDRHLILTSAMAAIEVSRPLDDCREMTVMIVVHTED